MNKKFRVIKLLKEQEKLLNIVKIHFEDNEKSLEHNEIYDNIITAYEDNKNTRRNYLKELFWL